jgi:hypothetical protein
LSRRWHFRPSVESRMPQNGKTAFSCFPCPRVGYQPRNRSRALIFPIEGQVMTNFSGFLTAHFQGESVTCLGAPPRSALAVLLLLAGRALPRRRALPAHSGTALPSTFNHGFQVQ